MSRKPLTDEMRAKVLELHRQYGVNHIIFLLDYEWDADDINQVLRDEIRRLRELEK